MKLVKSIYLSLMSLAFAGVISSCSDDVDAPKFEVPVATLEANTTIYDLKNTFWDDATNYATKIGTKENGDHYIVKGRVITSDYDGNIFKSITIQDETAALTFSVNTYNLYLTYRLGQELVVDMTDLHIGKYNGLQQVGAPEWYDKGNAYEVTFMAPQLFNSHVQLNGLPDKDKIITHELSAISEIPTGKEGLIRWQGQRVRMNNVTFIPQVNEADGQPVYTYGLYKQNFNQVVNLAGQDLTLRTSGYSNFFQELMPTEPCDMVCWLSYYGSDWQLMLISGSDVMNEGNPTMPYGSKENPWSVDYSIESVLNGTATSGWTKGYIVGTVAPEVTSVTSESDIEWGVDPLPTLNNTVVLGLTPDTRNLGECVIVPLPQDSRMREYAALREHPENLGKLMSVYGQPGSLMDATGILNNNGTTSEFTIEGVELPDDGGDTPTPGAGDGTEASPYNVDQAIALGNPGTTAWVKGYIVGWVDGADISAGSHFDVPATSASNVLIAANPNETDYSKCMPVQLVYGDNVRAFVNLKDNPGNLGKELTIEGTLTAYFKQAGIKTPTAYKLGEGGGTVTPTPTPGDGDGTEAKPYGISQAIALGSPGTASWVKGYIVGWVDGASIASGSHFEVPATSASNVLIADSPTETDYSKCMPVQLVYGDNVRAFVNLKDNPGNLGKELTIQGTLSNYFNCPGVKAPTAYKLGDGGSVTPTPTPGEGSGSGTEADPYDCAKIRTLNPTSTTEAVESGVWAEGYIVGYYLNYNCVFEGGGTQYANILLAPTADCKDANQVICVQLVSKTDPRAALNLGDNPGNLGKKCAVYGDVMKYNSMPGIKNTSNYKLY